MGKKAKRISKRGRKIDRAKGTKIAKSIDSTSAGTAKRLNKFLQKESNNWEAVRASYIGSSDIATICGLNEWETPLKLWARRTGRTQGVEKNAFMIWGSACEPALIELFQFHKPEFSLSRSNETVFDETRKFCATPDAIAELIGENTGNYDLSGSRAGIVELKTSSQYLDEIPFSYQLQLQWQLGLLNLDWGFVFIVCAGQPGKPLMGFSRRDPSIFEFAAAKATEFLKAIETETPPTATGGDIDTLKALFGQPGAAELIELPITDTLSEAVQNYIDNDRLRLSLEKELSEIEKIRLNAKAVLIQAMNGAQAADYAGRFKLSCKRIITEPTVQKGKDYLKFSMKEKKQDNSEVVQG